MTAVLVIVAALTVVVATQLDRSGDGSDQVIGPDGTPGPGETTTTEGDPTVVPAEGQVLVSGAVTAVELGDARLDPADVPTPLTVASDRGFGNGGEITGVTVDG